MVNQAPMIPIDIQEALMSLKKGYCGLGFQLMYEMFF